jgi:hypothetical protein
MDSKVTSKKIANNILEFLVDPSAFPLERRLYFRPEELLMNESFEKAKKESQQAYGDQRYNSDFYPNRPLLKREATSSMERKTLIASLDVLSQEFIESDPMAIDLRTMAYAVANMSEEDFKIRIVEAGNPWIEHMNKVRKDNPGKSFKEIASLAKKTFKKAEEEQPEAKEVPAEVLADNSWSKEASDAVQKALVAEIVGEEKVEKKAEACDDKKKKEEKEEKEEKEAAKPEKKEAAKPEKKEAAKPEKKEAVKEPEKKEAKEPEKKEAKEPEKKEAKEPEKKEATEEPEKKEAAEEKEESTEVDTDVLKSSHSEFGGIQLGAGMVTMEDIGELSNEEQQRLDQLFK